MLLTSPAILAKLVAQSSQMTTLTLFQLEKIFAYAREANPAECCGLIGGADCRVTKIYPLHKAAPDPNVFYEAAPQHPFAPQHQSADPGQDVLASSHCHPR